MSASVGGQTDVVTVTVTDGPLLTLGVSADPTAGEATIFTGSVDAGSNPIRSVRIQFGDGSAQSLGALGDSGTDVSHVYRRAGTFLVTLTATDVAGERTTITTSTVVAAQTPLSVTFDSTTVPTAGPPVSVSFAVTVAQTDVAISCFDWTFGDGTSPSTSGDTTSHVYTSSGNRTVKVTAVATDGRTATAQIQIVIPLRPQDWCVRKWPRGARPGAAGRVRGWCSGGAALRRSQPWAALQRSPTRAHHSAYDVPSSAAPS